MTRSWARLRWPALAMRQASPWQRKMSATSSFGRSTAVELCGRDERYLQGFQRALNLPDHARCHARIPRCGVDVPVSEQVLDDAKLDSVFQQMGRKAVSQCVHRYALGQSGRIRRL